ALACHHRRDLRGGDDIALGTRRVLDQLERFARHPHLAGCNCTPGGHRLAAHVNHPRATFGVQMGQVHAASSEASCSASTPSASCGLMFPCASSRVSSTRSIALTEREVAERELLV